MLRPIFFLSLICLTAAPAWAQNESLALGTQPRIVLLTNGEVISGQVTRTGDHYLVTLPNGELRPRAVDVEMVCQTLDEAYFRKRTYLPPGEAEGHLNLADWCVRQRLYNFAEREVEAAKQIDPRLPRIALVEQRLKVEQARAAEPLNEPKSSARGPSNEDLDRLVRTMPPGVVEHFKTIVQPLLLNHCTNAGCHGPQSSTKFTLNRLGKTSSLRLTQRNLFSTIEQLNRQSPAESPLLKQSVQAHGGTRSAVFGSREAQQYQQLVIWVFRAADSHVPQRVESPQAAVPERGAGVLLQNIDRPSDSKPTTMLKSLLPSESESRDKSSNFVPRDPFDPEIFNRQFLPEK